MLLQTLSNTIICPNFTDKRSLLSRPTILLFFLFLACSVWGQESRFHVGILSGLSLGQIDGDDMQGYDHKGFFGGLRSSAIVTDKFECQIELLYNRRGSQSKDQRSTLMKNRTIHADYAEINLLLAIKEWYNPFEKLYRLQMYGGVSLGRLTKIQAIDEGDGEILLTELVPEMNNRDLSLMGGGAYFLSQNVAIGMRFSRSISLLFDASKSVFGDAKVKNMQGYFIGLYGQYMFY